jgi:hypothetical protein
MTSRERIIDLVNQITTARAQLKHLEAELDQLLPGGSSQRKQPALKRARRGTLAGRVIHLLESEPAQVFRVADVAKRLGVSSVPSLRKTVLRLAAEHRIQRRQRGGYGATSPAGQKPAARARRRRAA